MGFSSKQVAALRRAAKECRYAPHPYPAEQRAELSYLEGWYVISQANRIFGFDGTRSPARRSGARACAGREIHPR